MTYEGSTTHPGCWETTTWIVFNKPIYVTRQEVNLTFEFPLAAVPFIDYPDRKSHFTVFYATLSVPSI